MSYSFLLRAGEVNTKIIPVGTEHNGSVAVLRRKSATLNSSGNVANGRATFEIPAERVTEFNGDYTVTVGGTVVQSGDIDLLKAAPVGGGGTTDLSNYPTKPEVNSQIAGATSGKADKTYVDNQLATKAGLTDIANKADKSELTPITTALDNKANTADVNTALSAKANASDVTSALATKADASVVNAKANAADVYTKAQSDAKYALVGSGGGGGASNFLILAPADPVPANTPNGTIILRKAV